MRIEEKRFVYAPYTCAVTGRNDAPMVDMDVDISGLDQHLYLRCSVVEDAGRLLGMVSKSELDEVTTQLKALEVKIEALRVVASAITKVEEGERELSDILIEHAS